MSREIGVRVNLRREGKESAKGSKVALFAGNACAFGTLEENGDTWLLMTPDRMLLLDVPLSDLSLEHKAVSVIGKMGIPPSAPGIAKLMVEKLANHDDIAIRTFDIFNSEAGGLQDDHWLRAERELLTITDVKSTEEQI